MRETVADTLGIGQDKVSVHVTFLGGGMYAYNVALTEPVTNNVLADADEQVYVLDNSSIQENASAAVLRAFPNPTEGMLQIETQNTGKGTLDVYTVTGQKVQSRNITGSVQTLSLAELPSGIYTVKVNQGGSTSVIRVVKK